MLRKSWKGLLKYPPKAKPTSESTRSAQIDETLKSEKRLMEIEVKIVLLNKFVLHYVLFVRMKDK